MSLSTHSRFYYGFIVDQTNNKISFDEGSGEVVATLNVGAYTATEYAQEVARAMTSSGAQDYAAAFDRSTREITVSAVSNFSLLVSTGLTSGTSALTMMGFTGLNRSGTNTYTGAASGSEYTTQFVLQDYVSSDDHQIASDATVNRSASGRVEVFSFGIQKFVEMNFKYLTNLSIPVGGFIRYKSMGVLQFRTMMQHLVKKAPIEFMPDEDDVATFQSLILEKTPEESKGVGYKLRELYGQGLPGYFESGVLTMRVIE